MQVPLLEQLRDWYVPDCGHVAVHEFRSPSVSHLQPERPSFVACWGHTVVVASAKGPQEHAKIGRFPSSGSERSV